MKQEWIYWICFVLQTSSTTAFHAQAVAVDHRIDSPEVLGSVIEALIQEHMPDQAEYEVMPVVPLTWTLLTARQVSGSGNGHEPG